MHCPVDTGNTDDTDPIEGLEYCSPEDQQAKMWEYLSNELVSSPPRWPTFQDIGADMSSKCYDYLFTKRANVSACPKLLCANGVICKVRIEWFSGHGYSGLFQSAEHGIMRLSSALGPLDRSLPMFVGAITQSKLFPCVAIKIFRGITFSNRHNAHSGNLLFGGKKTGQPDDFFFARSVATILTEKVNWLLSWVLSLFRPYSSYPTQLGLSDFAAVDSAGRAAVAQDLDFPWCLALYPTIAREDVRAMANREGYCRGDDANFLSTLESIPEGTSLYDVYCLPRPDAVFDSTGTQMQRIGRVITTSPFIRSAKDRVVYFKHQRREEDYEQKPYWLPEIVQLHAETGSGYFDEAVPQCNYVDFE